LRGGRGKGGRGGAGQLRFADGGRAVSIAKVEHATGGAGKPAGGVRHPRSWRGGGPAFAGPASGGGYGSGDIGAGGEPEREGFFGGVSGGAIQPGVKKGAQRAGRGRGRRKPASAAGEFGSEGEGAAGGRPEFPRRGSSKGPAKGPAEKTRLGPFVAPEWGRAPNRRERSQFLTSDYGPNWLFLEKAARKAATSGTAARGEGSRVGKKQTTSRVLGGDGPGFFLRFPRWARKASRGGGRNGE